jgi:arylsulfatase A-like enzyme
MPGPTRRDFLKLGSVLSGAVAVSRVLVPPASGPAAGTPLANVIVFVFDAMSAKHLSLYGYPRRTSPNLERFAARATVYHQHYAAGNFTTPGTASLLTGLYPWSHRAINQAGLVAPDRAHQNLFEAMGQQYHRLAYSQNAWPNYFFGQFEDGLETILSPGSFSLLDQVISTRFGADLANSHRAFDDLLFQNGHPPASLVFGVAQNMALYERIVRAGVGTQPVDVAHVTNIPIFFRLADVFDGMLATILRLKQPFLAYFHTWSPHDPYEPSREFAGLFQDDWRPAPKPTHALSRGTKRLDIEKQRPRYDRYVANVDFEFGRLLDGLQAHGLLDQSYVVVASDHGDMLERGDVGHMTPLLYDPVVRVPLVISSPGQTRRRDVHLPTSNVDLLPTLVHLAGKDVPAWAEGQVLPGLGGPEDPERSVFMCEAKENRPQQAWSQASYALRKGKYKLTGYMAYDQLDRQDRFELYDMEADPEELQDLYSQSSPTAQDLRRELIERVQAENAKYTKVD